jgi:ubiquinol-cytochrome c reductase cytochrome b subunit
MAVRRPKSKAKIRREKALAADTYPLDWLEERSGLVGGVKYFLFRNVPSDTNWMQTLGSATLTAFIVQALTGVILAMYYKPSPHDAYASIQNITDHVTMGWLVRGMHKWGASVFIILMFLHMGRVFLFGAYKYPRELNWIIGVLLLTMGMAEGFTGYLLPWDQTAYWATQVGINMVGTVPLVGDFLVKVMRGGEALGALTLSMFFAVHVLFLPAIIVMGIMLHLFILRRVGPAGPWDEQKGSSSSEAFYPRQVYMDAVVMLAVFAVLALLAGLGPFQLTDKANPSDTSFVPVPEWYFLFYYELLKHVHGPLEPFATWVLPGMAILVMLLWPLIDWKKTVRHPASRPVGMTLAVLFLITVFSLLGISLKNLYAVKRVDPAIAHGAALVKQLGCLGCHRIHGTGGAVGPDLSYVGDQRPDRAWHIKHFRDPQSVSPGSIMPKFPLKDEELNDLASYMLSLRRNA